MEVENSTFWFDGHRRAVVTGRATPERHTPQEASAQVVEEAGATRRADLLNLSGGRAVEARWTTLNRAVARAIEAGITVERSPRQRGVQAQLARAAGPGGTRHARSAEKGEKQEQPNGAHWRGDHLVTTKKGEQSKVKSEPEFEGCAVSKHNAPVPGGQGGAPRCRCDERLRHSRNAARRMRLKRG